MVQSSRSSDVEEVKKIICQIGDLENQLQEIQSGCSHVPEVGFSSSHDVKLRCSICTQDLGYPSLEDVHIFLKK